ncbi:4'-phosphopantetheinyl transferase family protein [Psychrobacillus sp. NPDC096426]|uniref:4'-phosphopantetheinyl transferase family protein n=1 Tax=Psychrobacillus sp. NPDC096426 TaxID=3364491 RepID=UPI00381FBEEE
MKLYIVNNWLKNVNMNEPRANWSVILIKKLLGNIDIQKYANGKPFILNENQFINWSHNDEYLVIALSELGQIGVDIENSNLTYDEQLYGWVLHKEEKHKLEQGRLFSEVWTRKEAILKCTGEGISENMCELNSYKMMNMNVTSLYISELCISVCSEVPEDIELYQIS